VKRLNLKAVHDDEIQGLLESLGLLEVVKSGHAICPHCGDVVTVENLNCIVPRGDEILLVCSKPDCIESAHPAPRQQ
jgi:hypothetical protein